jgi:hypothetical protein
MLVAGLLASLAGVGLTASAARADYTAEFCAFNGPAAPWGAPTDGATPFPGVISSCGSGGDFDLLTSAMSSGAFEDAGLAAPPGTVLTHMAMNFHTPASATGAILQLRYPSVAVLNQTVGDPNGLTFIDTALPGVASFSVGLFCPATQGCTAPPDNEGVEVGPMDVILHDTGIPAVQSTGGSLGAPGTVRGVQPILYTATDTGSGVARVTVSIGSTVAGTATSTCQVAALAPCPAAVSGTLSVDTRLLPDGTYPVILTAYDDSGDPASVQAATVTIANHSGSAPVTIAPPRRGDRLHVKVVAAWSWTAGRTRLRSLTLPKLPHGAAVRLSCRGRRCPRRRWTARPGRAKVLLEQLRRTTFHRGDRLTLTISEHGHRSERIAIAIRSGRRPLMELR